jgi:hypothetical protein
MHFTLTSVMSLRAVLAGALMLAACAPASAQSAYITQVSPSSSGFVSTSTSTSPPSIQLIPVSQNAARQTAFLPTPETAAPARSANIAQTLEIGSFNRVFQSQSGGNNFSNVGVIGGTNNNVGVVQGGKDQSNIGLINMQGYSVGVFQPPGAAPVNMLIARLPNGNLLIKR